MEPIEDMLVSVVLGARDIARHADEAHGATCVAVALARLMNSLIDELVEREVTTDDDLRDAYARRTEFVA